MKRCPTCNRTFEDTFTFCLIDGSILSAPFDPEATQRIPPSRPTDPSPTEVMTPHDLSNNPLHETIASPAPESISTEVADNDETIQPSASNIYGNLALILGGMILLGIIFIVMGSAAVGIPIIVLSVLVFLVTAMIKSYPG